MRTALRIVALAALLFTSGLLSIVSAAAPQVAGMPADAALSDGQFVYGPNVGDFSVRDYLAARAPHLLPHADDLYGRAEY